MTCGVYSIRRIGTDDCYIGSSVNVDYRWKCHRKALKAGTHHSPYLQRVWDKHGADAFEFILIERCDRSMLVTREQHHIDVMQSVFNWARASYGPVGVTRSEVTRAKLRAANRGRVPVNKGIPPSAEQLAKQRAAQTGKKRGPWPAERRAKLSASLMGRVSPMKGKHFSEEHRARLSASQKGKPKLALRGHEVSIETRQKIAAKALGNQRWKLRRWRGQKVMV